MAPTFWIYALSGLYFHYYSLFTKMVYSKATAARKRKAAALSRQFKQNYKKRGYTRQVGFYGRFNGPGAELKFHDVLTGQFNCSAAGVVVNTSLVEIPQGVTESTRIGRKCTVKKISIRGFYVRASQVTPNSTEDRIRVIIFHDRQCNGTQAQVLDILETAGIDSYRNLANSGRFNILRDTTIALNNLAGGGNGVANDYGRFTKNFFFNMNCNIPVEYSDVSGALGTIRSNNVGVLVINWTDAQTAMRFRTRIRFTDR